MWELAPIEGESVLVAPELRRHQVRLVRTAIKLAKHPLA